MVAGSTFNVAVDAPFSIFAVRFPNPSYWKFWAHDAVLADVNRFQHIVNRIFAPAVAVPIVTVVTAGFPAVDPVIAGVATCVALLSTYEQRIHRNFHRNLKFYRELKAERLAARNAEPPAPIEIEKPLTMAAAASAAENVRETNPQPAALSITSKEIGFVHANPVLAPGHAPVETFPTPNNNARLPEATPTLRKWKRARQPSRTDS